MIIRLLLYVFLIFLRFSNARPQYDLVPVPGAIPIPPQEDDQVGVAGAEAEADKNPAPTKVEKIFGEANPDRAQEDLSDLGLHGKPCATDGANKTISEASQRPSAPPEREGKEKDKETMGNPFPSSLHIISPPAPPSKAELAAFPSHTFVEPEDFDGSGETTTIDGETKVDGSGMEVDLNVTDLTTPQIEAESTVEGSGQSPIIETGPVEKKGDQFAAIITVGTSTQAQTETTKGMEITEGSGEMNDGSGEETTITMITEKDDALAREEASSSTQPEESAEGESPLSGYEQGNGERNGETTSKETIKETDKPERGGYASEKSGDHGKYSTTTVATEIAQASTPIDHKDKEPTDSEEIEVAELNKDAEKHMTEQVTEKIKEEPAKSETTQSTAAAGDPYAAIVLPAESKESTPSTVTTTAFDTTNAPTIKAETIKATNAPTIDSTTQETTSEKPIAFTEELISTTTTKTLLKNDDDSHETSKLEPLLEPENSSDQLKTTTTTFEQNGSVLANEISGEQPKELSTEEPTATTVKPKDAYPTPPPTNQATTKKPVEPPGLEPKIHPSGYEEGKGPTGPLQPDTKPIDPSHAVGYPGIPPIEKAKSRPERFLKNPLFESRGTRKELMPTAKIIAEKSLKKTWRPFVFDCATEEDEKGPLCRDWADGGLCERHRPTRFLFCRKTCLCVGPPHLR